MIVSELLHRVILLSGSGLSPWALQRDPLSVKRSVAEHTNCHGDLHEDDLAPCLRKKPLEELLKIRIDAPRFLPGGYKHLQIHENFCCFYFFLYLFNAIFCLSTGGTIMVIPCTCSY
jgi:hypothetical protein